MGCWSFCISEALTALVFSSCSSSKEGGGYDAPAKGEIALCGLGGEISMCASEIGELVVEGLEALNEEGKEDDEGDGEDEGEEEESRGRVRR